MLHIEEDPGNRDRDGDGVRTSHAVGQISPRTRLHRPALRRRSRGGRLQQVPRAAQGQVFYDARSTCGRGTLAGLHCATDRTSGRLASSRRPRRRSVRHDKVVWRLHKDSARNPPTVSVFLQGSPKFRSRSSRRRTVRWLERQVCDQNPAGQGERTPGAGADSGFCPFIATVVAAEVSDDHAAHAQVGQTRH